MGIMCTNPKCRDIFRSPFSVFHLNAWWAGRKNRLNLVKTTDSTMEFIGLETQSKLHSRSDDSEVVGNMTGTLKLNNLSHVVVRTNPDTGKVETCEESPLRHCKSCGQAMEELELASFCQKAWQLLDTNMFENLGFTSEGRQLRKCILLLMQDVLASSLKQSELEEKNKAQMEEINKIKAEFAESQKRLEKEKSGTGSKPK